MNKFNNKKTYKHDRTQKRADFVRKCHDIFYFILMFLISNLTYFKGILIMLELHLKMCLTPLLVPRPPRSEVVGDYWIRVRPSVCLSVNFFFLCRDRTPKQLGRIEWNFLQWKNIYWSCAHGFWFRRATKIGVARLEEWGISIQ